MFNTTCEIICIVKAIMFISLRFKANRDGMTAVRGIIYLEYKDGIIGRL